MSIFFFSNKIEKLYEKLRDDLFFLQKNPLREKVIIVPSLYLKGYLMEKFALDPKLNIVAGVKIIPLFEAINFFTSKVDFEKKYSPIATQLDIDFAIETILRDKKKIFLPILEKIDTDKAFYALCESLSKLFIQYGIYGQKFIAEHPWQKELFSLVFENFSTPYEVLNRKIKQVKSHNVEIHFFCCHFMPEVYFAFFTKICAFWQIHHYMLSPTVHFWGDYLSNYEVTRLTENSSIDDILKEQNSLLANFGMLGKKYLEIIDNYEIVAKDHYVIEDDPLSLLNRLQMDLLLLQSHEDIIDLKEDNSIRITKVSSKLREVEVLQEILLDLIEKNELEPSDIVILAPDIDEYTPFIEMAIDTLPFTIMNRQQSSDFDSGFFQILDLCLGKWSYDQVISLFANPLFQKKLGIKEGDYLKISKWFSLLQVRWGMDAEHKGTFIDAKEKMGTWDKALNRLLCSLVFCLNEVKDFPYEAPLEEINFSDMDLIEKVIDVLLDLKKDISYMQTAKLDLLSWTTLLQSIATGYLGWDKKEFSFKRSHPYFEQELFPFLSIYEKLKRDVPSAHSQFALNSLTFSSLNEGSFRPAKMIYFMGMEEDVFPRYSMKNSLNLLESQVFVPSSNIKDRFLFLENLLSAENYLYFSYQGINPEDGKNNNPSLLIKELFANLDKNYRIEGSFPSKVIEKTAPIYFFDKSYFEDPSFSKRAYEAAKAYYQKEGTFSFIPQFSGKASPIEEKEIENDQIDIREIAAFAKNPFKYYVKKVLKIDLEKQGFAKSDETNDFLITPLNRYHLRGEFLSQKIEDPLQEFEKKQKLPVGVFGKISRSDLIKENIEYHQALEKLDLCKEDVFTYDLTENPIELELEEKKITLIGKIFPMTKLGLILDEEDKIEKAALFWPQLLILAYLNNEDMPSNYIFLKTGSIKEIKITDPKIALQDYIRYYFLAKKEPSPMIRNWIKALLIKDKKLLEKEISKIFEQNTMGFIDPYLKWAFSHGLSPNTEVIFSRWENRIDQVFQPLVHGYEKNA